MNYVHAIWAGICVLSLFLGALYERHQGAAACVNADTKAGLKAEVKTEVGEARATDTVKAEAETYDKATAPVTAPPLLVCPPAKPSVARRVLPAATAESVSPAESGPPSRDTSADMQGELDVQTLLANQRRYGAIIAELQDYALKVCHQ